MKTDHSDGPEFDAALGSLTPRERLECMIEGQCEAASAAFNEGKYRTAINLLISAMTYIRMTEVEQSKAVKPAG